MPRLDASGETLAQSFVQFRVVRLPDAISALQLAEIDAPGLEEQSIAFHLPKSSALFRVRIAAGVEDHAVTGFEWDLRANFNKISANLLDAPGERTALLA